MALSERLKTCLEAALGLREMKDELVTAIEAGSAGAVSSVNGHTGVVVVTKSDVGLGNADNTSDANKPISTATSTALSGKASTSLNNLSSTSIDAALLPDADVTRNLGSASHRFSIGYIERLKDSSDSVVFVPDTRTTFDSSGIPSIDGGNRILKSASSVNSVLWDLRQLRSSANGTSVHWENRLLIDNAGGDSVRYQDRKLIANDGITEVFDWSVAGSLNAKTNKVINVVDPVSAQDAATKNYVDNKVQVFTSSAGAGGSSTEALTVTGLLATDTILSVSQKTPGGNSLPLLGYSTLANNSLTGIWSANPGAGSVIIVSIKR